MNWKAEACGLTAEFEDPTKGRGHWISTEIDDADAKHPRLKTAGVEIVQPLADQPWGEYNVVVHDPDGVLIFIAHKIEVAEAMKPFFKQTA
jgi:uncharacterized glyoxalase superfamily protein PhnB